MELLSDLLLLDLRLPYLWLDLLLDRLLDLLELLAGASPRPGRGGGKPDLPLERACERLFSGLFWLILFSA